MCQEYEALRIRASVEQVSENDFLTLASCAPCFFANSNLFAEVHELWLADIARAHMHRVDPFQAALQLLRSRLNPLNQDEKLQRKRLQSEVMGPLKNPKVEFDTAPFALPPSPVLEGKTSLKQRLARADDATGDDSSGSGRLRTFFSSLTKKV